MRDRSVIINRIMKVPKKFYLAVALLIFAGGAGTALAMQPAPEKPKTVEVQQVAAVEPVEESTEPVESTPAVVEQQTIVEEEPPVEPPVETLQEEAERRTKDRAIKYGLNPDKQWQCMNKDMMAFAETHSEAQIREIVDKLLVEQVTESRGLVLVYFDHNCMKVAGGDFQAAN